MNGDLDARSQEVVIGVIFAGLGGALLHSPRTDPFAIDVGCERDISELRKLFDSALLVVVDAVPVVHDDHGWKVALFERISDLALKDRLAVLIFEWRDRRTCGA